MTTADTIKQIRAGFHLISSAPCKDLHILNHGYSLGQVGMAYSQASISLEDFTVLNSEIKAIVEQYRDKYV